MYTRGMHMYQKHILDMLRKSERLRYTELRPDGVESSHFKYHLDELRREGLVERIDRGVYKLTKKGLMAVDRLSVGRINPHQTPKVITYTLLYDADHYYFYRKPKAPFLDTLNLVAGKVHLDETTRQASIREVYEKTGLRLQDVHHTTVAEVRIRNGGELVSHFIAYLYSVQISDTAGLVPIAKNEVGQCSNLAPDTLALITAITNEEPFVNLAIES